MKLSLKVYHLRFQHFAQEGNVVSIRSQLSGGLCRPGDSCYTGKGYCDRVGRVGRVEESGEQERMDGPEVDSGAGEQAAETFGDGLVEEGSAGELATSDSPAEHLTSDNAIAGFSIGEDALLHTQSTDLSLIAVGGASEGATALPESRQRSRPHLRIAFPRGRLALLGPLAAVLLIVGVVLTGLGAQGRGIADLLNAPFAASRAHATATHAPTSTVVNIPIVGTPTPQIRYTHDRMRDRNAAMGCADGKPPALTKPIYTSKGFASGVPAPNEVALTFDDGPTPYTTPPILDYLEQNHVPATFFVEGLYARVWPYLVQREWNDGFAIGMHSWDHPVLTILPDGQMPHQFGDSLSSIHAAIGKDACIWFWRPPYGSYDPRILGVAQSYGLTTIMWDDDSVDYSRPGPDHIAATVLSEAHPGAVILMHDGPARREQTLAALPIILAGLKARGLKPVTLPQLLRDSQYPGVDTTQPSWRDKPDIPVI
jgi:peptidoglycan/xylan/chitin deacetylase (PgdA/CDA1 family)